MELLQQIRRHLYLFIIAVLVAGAVGYAISAYLITPEYESAVMMIVNTKQENTTVVTNDNITSAKNLVSTYSIIVKSNTVLDQIIDRLDLDMDYGELYNMISVSAVDDTQIMRIAVRSEDPKVATQIVEQVSEIAPDIIVDAAEAGSCKVISKVMESEEPVSPNVTRNTVLAMILGLMFAIIFVVLRAVTKEVRIIDDGDVQRFLDLPVIGVIPEVEGTK
jgi:capsular polysaccharide biosynthesis protein